MITIIIGLIVFALIFWFLPRDIAKVHRRDMLFRIRRIRDRYNSLKEAGEQVGKSLMQFKVNMMGFKGPIEKAAKEAEKMKEAFDGR